MTPDDGFGYLSKMLILSSDFGMQVIELTKQHLFGENLSDINVYSIMTRVNSTFGYIERCSWRNLSL